MSTLVKNHIEEKAKNVVRKEVIGYDDYVTKAIEINEISIGLIHDLKKKSTGIDKRTISIINESLRYDLNWIAKRIVFEFSRYLNYKADDIPRKRKENLYKQYRALYEDLNKTVQAEESLALVLSDIDFKINRKLNNEEILPFIKSEIEKINSILYQFHSIDFILAAYKIKTRYAQIINDTELIKSISEEALDRLNEKPYQLPNIAKMAFFHPVINFYLEKEEYNKAQDIAESLLSETKRYTANWFVVHSYLILIMFRNQDFELAVEEIEKGRQYFRRKSLDNIHAQRYELYDAYVSLFTNKKFKLGKFTNEVFEISKDRSGYRINVIIVNLLHLLKNNKKGALIDRHKATEVFISKFTRIKGNRLKRSKLFLKILNTISQSNFNSIAFKRKTEKLHNELKSVEKRGINSMIEQEPIDFEFLYKYILSFL